MNHTSELNIINIPRDDKFLLHLVNELKRVNLNIFHDLSKGKSIHEVVTDEPTTDTIDEGVFVLRNTSPPRLYSRVGDDIVYLEFTVVP